MRAQQGNWNLRPAIVDLEGWEGRGDWTDSAPQPLEVSKQPGKQTSSLPEDFPGAEALFGSEELRWRGRETTERAGVFVLVLGDASRLALAAMT